MLTGQQQDGCCLLFTGPWAFRCSCVMQMTDHVMLSLSTVAVPRVVVHASDDWPPEPTLRQLGLRRSAPTCRFCSMLAQSQCRPAPASPVTRLCRACACAVLQGSWRTTASCSSEHPKRSLGSVHTLVDKRCLCVLGGGSVLDIRAWVVRQPPGPSSVPQPCLPTALHRPALPCTSRPSFA